MMHPSLTYSAFPDARAGTIKITFVRRGNLYVLEVEDDGAGLPPTGLRVARGTGIGRRLPRSMVAQLGGSFEITSGDGSRGSRAAITFPVEEAKVHRERRS